MIPTGAQSAISTDAPTDGAFQQGQLTTASIRFRPIADIRVAASLKNVGHIFISYAREDRHKVQALANALEKSGLPVWLDERLVAGSEFDAAIEEALAQATKVIVAWSPASVVSRWVKAEAGEGLDRRILVPVVIEPTRIPLEFRRVQAVDLTNWQGDTRDGDYVRVLEALTATSDTKTGAPDRDAVQPQSEQKRLIEKASEFRAECLYSSKTLSALRIRLWQGRDSVSIRHTSAIIRQKVKVDGKTVSTGPWTFLHDYHRFPIELNGVTHIAELTVSGSPIMGMDGFTLRIGGEPVLSGHLSWKDHWYEAAVLGSLLLLFLIAVDPLQYVL